MFDATPLPTASLPAAPSIRRRAASLGRSRVAVLVMVALALHSAPGTAGERNADHSLVELARASLSAAASRALYGAETVATFALSLVGVDYRWGGATPAQGFDCSGLIRYVFQRTTGVALPRTARGLANVGARVTRSDLAPGDLVFFNTRRAAFSHVGIYLGNDRFIHAPSRGGEVGVAMLSSAYWKKRYDGARRLIGVLPELVPQFVSSAWAANAQSAPAPSTGAAAELTEPPIAAPDDDAAAPVSGAAREDATAWDTNAAPNATAAPGAAGAATSSHLSDNQP